MVRLFDRWLIAGMTLLVVFVVFNVGLTLWNLRKLQRDARWAAHTYEMTGGLERLQSLVLMAETEQRDYLLTGEPDDSASYARTKEDIRAHLSFLRRLTPGEVGLQHDVAAIDEVVSRRLRETDHFVRLRADTGFAVAYRAARKAGSKPLDSVRDTIQALLTNQHELLTDRSRHTTRTYRVALVTSFLGGLAALWSLSAFLRLLRRHLRTRAQGAADLNAHRKLLKTTLASIGDAVLTTEARGNITFMNGVAQELTGWSSDDATGQPLDAVFRLQLPTAEGVIGEALGTSPGSLGDGAERAVLLARDGTEVPIDRTIAPIHDEDGRRVGTVIVFRDTSERQAAERALLVSEHRLRLAQQVARIGTFDWNVQNGANMWTPELEAMHGLAPGTFGATVDAWLALIHEDDRERVRSRSEEAMITGTFAEEWRIVRPNRVERWVAGRGQLFRDASGRPWRLIGVNIDITDARNAEEALREADRRKDEFLATLSHELRNPLAPIRNALSILQSPAASPATVRAAHGVMDRQINQMVRLVDDLLDVSRITRGKLELRAERVTLEPILRQAIETCRPMADALGHEISVSLGPEPIHLLADSVRLAQVFANLLNNACKFTERGGHIYLSATLDGSEAIVSVRDTGMGIPADALPGIFEMFSQVDRTIERAHGGLGIGLTLVKRIVDLHGGRVEARSDGLGKGSEFVVRLPVPQLADQLPEASPRASGARGGDGATTPIQTILVVDDNLDSAETLAQLLEIMGNVVHVAHDGFDAIALAESIHPDVIFLDIGLPGMSGYDTARQIRERPWSETTKIFALTGLGREDDRSRSRDAGFDRHLVKPVYHEELEALLGSRGTPPEWAS